MAKKLKWVDIKVTIGDNLITGITEINYRKRNVPTIITMELSKEEHQKLLDLLPITTTFPIPLHRNIKLIKATKESKPENIIIITDNIHPERNGKYEIVK